LTGEGNLTGRLAEFARTAKPGPELATLARRHITDTVAVMAAGRVSSVARLVAAAVGEDSPGGGPGWQVGGSSGPIAGSALVNGACAHALDFDDDDPLLCVGHPSGPVLAALLALAPLARPTGSALVDSYLVGVEVQLQLGKLVNPSHYDRGWHATATLGALGAAAAAARILDLSETQISSALALAASGAGGLRVNFGTMAKPIQVGNAAQVAVTAALLARRGATAAPAVLDGPLGYPAMVSCPHVDPLTLLPAGDPWLLETSGLAIKRYPCCSNTHTAIDGLLDLRAEHWSEGTVASAELDEIICRVSPGTETIVPYHRPATGLQGKFSIEHCLAVGWLTGAARIADFTDDRVRDPEVRAVAGKVTVVVDPAIERGPTGVSTRTIVELAVRGRPRLAQDTDTPVGSPRRPMSDDKVREKATECLAEAMPPAAVPGALEVIWALPDAPDVAAAIQSLPRIEAP
jgi:2-methylcitrate dehydratase PrpD